MDWMKEISLSDFGGNYRKNNPNYPNPITLLHKTLYDFLFLKYFSQKIDEEKQYSYIDSYIDCNTSQVCNGVAEMLPQVLNVSSEAG